MESKKVGFKASIQNETDKSADDIIREADKIWQRVRHWDGENDEIHRRMQMEHNSFAQSYPIVLRYMCEYRWYRTAALKQYLTHVRNHPWKSTIEFLQSQATYVTMLYKSMTPKWSPKNVETLQQNVFNTLKSEYDYFENNTKEISKVVEEKHDKLMSEYNAITKKFFQNDCDTFDVPVVAVFDEQITVQPEPIMASDCNVPDL